MSIESSSGPNRVLRGGSWSFDLQYARVAFRLGYPPGFRYYYLGFRLMRRCL